MEKLGTFLLLVFVFSTLKQTLHANNNCVEPKFLNQQNDFLCVQVNQDINITFALDWVHCSLSTSEYFINVVGNNSSHADVECRLSVNKSTCRVSDNTPGCWCMSPTGPVTFTERFTHAVNITYTLQWHRADVTEEKNITVRVFEVSPTCGRQVPEDDSPPASFSLPGLVSGCAVLAVVGILVLLFFLRKNAKGSGYFRSLQQNERRQTTGDFVSQNRADGKCHVTQYEDVWDAVDSQSIAGTRSVDLTESETNIYSNS